MNCTLRKLIAHLALLAGLSGCITEPPVAQSPLCAVRCCDEEPDRLEESNAGATARARRLEQLRSRMYDDTVAGSLMAGQIAFTSNLDWSQLERIRSRMYDDPAAELPPEDLFGGVPYAPDEEYCPELADECDDRP